VEETICTLYSNTYRAHQVISEVKNDRWGSASEERLTHIKASSNGSTFCKMIGIRMIRFIIHMLIIIDIFLFDKDRTLQENRQIFETDYTNAKSLGILNGVFQNSIRKPITRLIGEEEVALIPTFLTSPGVENLSLSGPIQHESGIRVLPTSADSPVTEASLERVFVDSTRRRFLSHILTQGRLDLPRSESRDDLIVLKVKLAFTRMIAQDWDLVLSQIGQTLDDIDRKISDNAELRKNVLAWRRLLGSWRMTNH
jgi:hypothetical protein